MSYNPIVTVSIALETSPISRASFGLPIFISDHVWFTERSRSYTSLEAVAADVPTGSDAYIGALAAFSQDVPPEQVKLGRRELDDITFTPEDVTATGQTYSLTVVGTDDVAITASFVTATGSETADEIITDLVTDLSGIVGVTVVDNTGTMTLSKSGVDDFSIQDVDRLTFQSTSTESAADMMAAITAEDDDFYFVACNDHTDTFVMSLAAEVEARTKIYFVGLQDVANLAAYSEIATFTTAKLRQNAYLRTSAWYHHEADTKFPEMAYIAVAAPADPGKKVWANNKVSGFAAAKNVSTGNPLSVTEKGNLTDASANYTEVVGGITITRRGTVAGNEWINLMAVNDSYEIAA